MSGVQVVGEVTPQEAWEKLQADTGVCVVDVRTESEWSQIGVPDLGDRNSDVYLISWQFAPDMSVNPNFVADLEAAGVPKDSQVLFLCRSGVRSLAAAQAAQAAGYGSCFNIANGFEGIAGPDGRRHGGWLGLGLPMRFASAKG